MCEYCHTYPHMPGCPNAPEPEVVGTCAWCEEDIITGEAYADINGKMYHTPTPKVSGVSTSTDWEIESIDASKVPTEVAGVIIRPVDEAAVKRLIRMSKGAVQIPGVVYKKTTKISLGRS